MQKVWFRKSKAAWYATITEGGQQRQFRLVKAPNNPDGRKLAEKHLIDELASRNISTDTEGVREPRWATVAHVLQAFLKHSAEEHDKETADWHRRLLSSFTAMHGKLRYRPTPSQGTAQFATTRGKIPSRTQPPPCTCTSLNIISFPPDPMPNCYRPSQQ